MSADDRPVSVGVVGLGYWGPNLARNFAALEGCELRWCCDALPDNARKAPAGTQVTTELGDLLSDDGLDAIVVATDVPSHARLAIDVLRAGKHCFVEKPLAQSAQEATAVAEEAAGGDRVLMVGHLLEYHPGVEKLKEILDAGQLGDVRYVYSNRLNLGLIRDQENALWSLGAHDISVLLHLFDGEEPEEAVAHGRSFMRDGVEDVVFCYLRFPSGRVAHMHLSWLDPHKERRFTVVGEKRMATFDDMVGEQKVTIYDKGFDRDLRNWDEYIARSGDITSPQISNEEPLRIECRHFLDCVRTGTEPRSGAASGLRAVRVLEALQRSLESGGTPQRLQTAGPVA
jgi:predicted dehydrogenase